jgi:hypothetical protein
MALGKAVVSNAGFSKDITDEAPFDGLARLNR